MDNSISIPVWDQLPNEPFEQYEWFIKYFVALGSRRNLRKAFQLWLMEADPEAYATNPYTPTFPEWKLAFETFDWTERARQFDSHALEQALKTTADAARLLRESAVKAVETLVEQLQNPRNSVSAANSLLDRAGIKTAAVTVVHNLTAEDLKQAEEELEKWKSNNKE